MDSTLERSIRRAGRSGKLPHSVIFSGSGDLTAAARFYAAALECTQQDRPCLHCPACSKVLRGIHPDVITAGNDDGKDLSVEALRALRSDAFIQPNEGACKVFLFPDCRRLTVQDQNVLLKLVEEGPSYAAFLFCAENPGVLLPTVRSRCETLELAPVSPAQAEEWLAKAFPGRTAEEIRRAALECQGILGRAAALLEGDMPEYIRNMNASGASSRTLLRNVVPALHPERTEMAAALDRAAALLEGRGAWRIHGGGFAGCIQCLVPAADYEAFRAAMDSCYGEGACFELRIRGCGAYRIPEEE